MNRASILTWVSAGVFACTPAIVAEPIYPPPLSAESCIDGRDNNNYPSLSDFELMGVEQSHEFVSAIDEASGALTDCFLSGPTAVETSAQSSFTDLTTDSWWTGLTGFAIERFGSTLEVADVSSVLPDTQLSDKVGPPLFDTSPGSVNDEIWSIPATDHLALADDLVGLDGVTKPLLDAKGFSMGSTTNLPQCEAAFLSENDSTGPTVDVQDLFASIDWLLPKEWWGGDQRSDQQDVVPGASTTEQGPTFMATMPAEPMFSPTLTVDGLLPMSFEDSTIAETTSYPVLREPKAMWPFEPTNELPSSPLETDVISQAAVLGETGRDVVRSIIRHNEELRFTLGAKDIIR